MNTCLYECTWRCLGLGVASLLGAQGAVRPDGILQVLGHGCALCHVLLQVGVKVAVALATQLQLLEVVHPCGGNLVVVVVDAVDRRAGALDALGAVAAHPDLWC